jgi:hypothetical protein
MTLNVPQQRLFNHRLAGKRFRAPEEVVHWLGAVQSQDYGAAKWAIGQRAISITGAAVDEAFSAGSILRTHVMRPTWHLVMPSDIRWLLALTAPRVNAVSAHYYRKLELDERVFVRSNRALEKALRGGHHLTRAEISDVYRACGINATGLRLSYLLLRAEIDAVVCSGPLRGKQFTYALFDERVPATKPLERDEALAKLTKRYFHSHGPALVHDFAWWSGLTVTDAKTGIELSSRHLSRKTVDGKTYWSTAGYAPQRLRASPTMHLLPNFDEYLIAYKDYAPITAAIPASRKQELIAHLLVLDGQVIGGWRRTIGKQAISVMTNLMVKLNKAASSALDAELKKYSRFMGMPVVLLQ